MTGAKKYIVKMGLLYMLPGWIAGAYAQQYTGLTGLIQVPSAEMNNEGEARIGAHYIPAQATPGEIFSYEGKKYPTFSYYLSLTPFRWIEIGYTCTLLKRMNAPDYDGHGYEEKDQYFSLKLNPLREGGWWPAVAVGCNDVSDSYSFLHVNGDEAVESFWGNYYVAASKHYRLKKETFVIHLAYRRYVKKHNRKWNGVVGGITWRPSFASGCRLIVEYTGNEINAGADCLLWKHLLLQLSLQQGRYLAGGICYQLNLF